MKEQQKNKMTKKLPRHSKDIEMQLRNPKEVIISLKNRRTKNQTEGPNLAADKDIFTLLEFRLENHILVVKTVSAMSTRQNRSILLLSCLRADQFHLKTKNGVHLVELHPIGL